MTGFDPYMPHGDSSRPGNVEASPYAAPYERHAPAPGQPPTPYLPAHLTPYGANPPWSGQPPYPPSAVAPARSGMYPPAIAGLALGFAAIATLGVIAGVVSAGVGLVGLVTSTVALVLARGSRGGAAGTAVAGLITSAIAVVLSGVVFLVSGTGVGGSAGWLGGGSELPIVPLRPGESGSVGDYTVTVQEIRMSADPAGRRSAVDGAYLEAVVAVTYEGRGVGNVGDDLLVSYAGSDDEWFYDEWGCLAVTESPVSELAPMRPGETATFVSCMDVPADVVDEAAVIVEDLNAPTFSAEMWGER
jgi:hypothetical protein